MSAQISVKGIALPTSKVVLEIKVTADLNVSAFIARQKANRFLIMQAGDQLCASEPELSVGEKIVWRVPIAYAPSRRCALGIVGHLLVDAENGEVIIADNQTAEDFLARAEVLNARATLRLCNRGLNRFCANILRPVRRSLSMF